VKLRIAPMLGFNWIRTAAITIAGIELLHRIHTGQFDLGKLRLKDRTAPAIWITALSARQSAERQGLAFAVSSFAPAVETLLNTELWEVNRPNRTPCRHYSFPGKWQATN
jgi:hypothetical protein